MKRNEYLEIEMREFQIKSNIFAFLCFRDEICQQYFCRKHLPFIEIFLLSVSIYFMIFTGGTNLISIEQWSSEIGIEFRATSFSESFPDFDD